MISEGHIYSKASMKDFLSDRKHSALPKGHGISFSLILDTWDIMTCTKRWWVPNWKCIILTTNTTTCKDRQWRELSPRTWHEKAYKSSSRQYQRLPCERKWGISAELSCGGNCSRPLLFLSRTAAHALLMFEGPSKADQRRQRFTSILSLERKNSMQSRMKLFVHQ